MHAIGWVLKRNPDQLYSSCVTAQLRKNLSWAPKGVLLAVRTEDGLDRRFTMLDELNEAVDEQVDWINERTPFRNEQRSSRAWFDEPEPEALIGLPEQPWQQVDWRKVKVSRDWHVQVDTMKYSVPHEYAGRKLQVRLIGERVEVLADGEIIAEHSRGARLHGYVTDPAHAPAGYEDTSLLWSRAYFLRQAAKVGPYTEQALTRLLDSKKIDAQGYRACLNILGLGKGTNRALLERACHDACTADERSVVSYTGLKHPISALRGARAHRPSVNSQLDAPLPVSAAVRVGPRRAVRVAYALATFSHSYITGE